MLSHLPRRNWTHFCIKNNVSTVPRHFKFRITILLLRNLEVKEMRNFLISKAHFKSIYTKLGNLAVRGTVPSSTIDSTQNESVIHNSPIIPPINRTTLPVPLVVIARGIGQNSGYF